MRILHLQYFFKYVLTYFLHLNSYLVTFLYNTICSAQLICPSVSFGISFEHSVQLPFTVLLYSTFPDNYAFLSLSLSQIKNTQSADRAFLLIVFFVSQNIYEIIVEQLLLNKLLQNHYPNCNEEAESSGNGMLHL